jgi:hypothetical protein
MKLRLRVEFEPRDLWVGVYWRRTAVYAGRDAVAMYWRWDYDLYLCLLPTLPIHLRWSR